MNRTEFIVLTAVILFVAFVLGWFGHWLVHRFARVKNSEMSELDKLAHELHEAEEQRDQAVAYYQQRERERRVGRERGRRGRGQRGGRQPGTGRRGSGQRGGRQRGGQECERDGRECGAQHTQDREGGALLHARQNAERVVFPL